MPNQQIIAVVSQWIHCKEPGAVEAPRAMIVEHGLSLSRISALIIRRNAARLRPTGLELIQSVLKATGHGLKNVVIQHAMP